MRGCAQVIKSTHSTPRAKARGMPFDKFKAPSTAEGLRVDTERRFLPRFENRGLAPSNVPNFKIKDLTFKISMVYDEHHFNDAHHMILFKKKFQKKKEVI